MSAHGLPFLHPPQPEGLAKVQDDSKSCEISVNLAVPFLPSCTNRLLKAGPSLTALIKACLQPDPADRPTAAQLLATDFFQEFAAVAEEEVLADFKRAAMAVVAAAAAAPVGPSLSPLCVEAAAGSCSAAEAKLSQTSVSPKVDSRWREQQALGRVAIKSILKVGQASNHCEITHNSPHTQHAVIFNPDSRHPHGGISCAGPDSSSLLLSHHPKGCLRQSDCGSTSGRGTAAAAAAGGRLPSARPAEARQNLGSSTLRATATTLGGVWEGREGDGAPGRCDRAAVAGGAAPQLAPIAMPPRLSDGGTGAG